MKLAARGGIKSCLEKVMNGYTDAQMDTAYTTLAQWHVLKCASSSSHTVYDTIQHEMLL